MPAQKAGRQIYRLSKTHVCSESQGIMQLDLGQF
jgi:hypothetical protein